jgi:hypothetical protein
MRRLVAHVHAVTGYAHIQRPSYKTLIDLPESSLTQISGILTAIAIAGGQGYYCFKANIDNNVAGFINANISKLYANKPAFIRVL